MTAASSLEHLLHVIAGDDASPGIVLAGEPGAGKSAVFAQLIAGSPSSTPECDKEHHPSLVPWEALSESEKEKDRDTVRNIPELLELAGFGVVGVSRHSEPFRAPSAPPIAE